MSKKIMLNNKMQSMLVITKLIMKIKKIITININTNSRAIIFSDSFILKLAHLSVMIKH